MTFQTVEQLQAEIERLRDALSDITHRILMDQTVAQQCEQDEDVLKIVRKALYPRAKVEEGK